MENLIILTSSLHERVILESIEDNQACIYNTFYYFFKLCGNGPGACCLAENLDNPLTADFTKGEISTFTGSTLGECNGFDMGAKIDWANAMTIYHSGLDGAQFDSVVVYTQDLVAKCYFYKFLEGKDSEHGIDCTVVKMNP